MQSLLDSYSRFIEISQSNPAMAGLVGVWVGAMITWALRSVPQSLFNMVMSQITSTITLTNAGTGGNDRHFTAFQVWARSLKGSAFTKRYFISAPDYTGKAKPDVTSGFGFHFFIYRGRLFWYHKTKLDSSGSDMEKYEITVRGFTRSRSLIDEMIEDFRYRVDREGTTVVEWERFGWGDSFNIPKRDINTVILNLELKAKITETIRMFINSESFYRTRSLPYKLTCILEGKPGCGKSSLVRAIAGWLGRDIYTLNLNLVTDESLMKAIRGIEKNSILLIEDFDSTSAVNKRTGIETNQIPDEIVVDKEALPPVAHTPYGDFILKQDNNSTWLENVSRTYGNRLMPEGYSDNVIKALMQDETPDSNQSPPVKSSLSLSAFLNALDGVVPLDNVIVFMTTNVIDNIDPALLRKGRVDHIFNIPYLEDEEVITYIETMCPGYSYPIDRRFKPIAGCDLQALYLEHKHDPALFIDSIPYDRIDEKELPKLHMYPVA